MSLMNVFTEERIPCHRLVICRWMRCFLSFPCISVTSTKYSVFRTAAFMLDARRVSVGRWQEGVMEAVSH